MKRLLVFAILWLRVLVGKSLTGQIITDVTDANDHGLPRSLQHVIA